MDVYKAIETRKSVREFDSRPVDTHTVDRVLEAARLAPSAKNRQEWRFVVVTDGETREALQEAAHGQSFVGQAPVVIVACAETDRRMMHCGHLAFLVDVAIAIDHITLAAVEEGLGTCWIGYFDPDKVRSILGIPGEVEVVQLIPLGYPTDPAPTTKPRHPLEEIVHRERWGRR